MSPAAEAAQDPAREHLASGILKARTSTFKFRLSAS